MTTSKRTFFYQPNPLTSTICWSWTFILLLLGIIFWLEVTQFSWITLFFFTLFTLISAAQLYFRKITIENGQFMVGHVMNPNWLRIPMHNINNLHAGKFTISFDYQQNHYLFMLPANSVIEINGIINAYQ
ncbi:EbsA family protein [Nicoliella spurrieriana]|uniref:EbsA family protein n=1 Tax=Nicoliella spurrieriana TaxID=2925830 RepID=A0A976RRS8_9LACO|nr:EbsA family protein [Nicoliella spurrieriana]UQS86604.1 EbsA family protein [Nicoliella spurrieriana]